MEIIYSSKFAKDYRKLPNIIKANAEELEKVFRADPFHSKLKTHKLRGKLSGFFAFSIGYKYRIIFEFANERSVVYFHAVGGHDIYD